jgi:ribosomal protein S18 acetylase RimI-like enzyme
MSTLTNYVITVEKFAETYNELEPLYQQHYAEMTERLGKNGIKCSPFNPRLDKYAEAGEAGWLLTFVLRADGKACGYINVYITNDMHNQDLIAQEDALFVINEHRNGVGKKLVQFGLEELKKRGVKRLNVSAMTDLRVAKLWKRMGFKEAATQMLYTF